VLNVLDKSALVPWAVRTALGRVREELGASDAAALQRLLEPVPCAVPGRVRLDEVLDLAAQEADRVRDGAADFGTRAHAVMDRVIRGEFGPGESVDRGAVLAACDPDTWPVLQGFLTWMRQTPLRLLPMGDSMVVSHRFRYAGSLDCLGYTPSGESAVVVDFKTSTSVHASYALQLAAYATAVSEMMQDPADKTFPPPFPKRVLGLVVRFDRLSGAPTEYHVADMKVAFDGFKCALLLWRLLHNAGEATVAPSDKAAAYSLLKPGPAKLP
jgi:PD-(D/E)XK nuclease superfamily